MNRRSLLAWLGLAPVAAVVAKPMAAETMSAVVPIPCLPVGTIMVVPNRKFIVFDGERYVDLDSLEGEAVCNKLITVKNHDVDQG
jgi:hypothetical protein